MKAIFFAILFSPVIGFSQIHKYEVTNDNIETIKKEWYKNREDKKESKKEFFRSLYQLIPKLDLVLRPEIYIPVKDSNIVSLEFIQDSILYYKSRIINHPIIKSFDKNYGIGLVKDYMIDDHTVGVYIRKTYKNGNSELYYIKMHLDYALMYYTDNFIQTQKSPDEEFENYYKLND
jgi:hypothetical protein